MKIRVIFDRKAGLCPGVKRTIIDALKASEKEPDIVSYGELIHNPLVVSRLREKGIRAVNELYDIEKGQYVIIRAHGIPPSDEAFLAEHGIRYADLTCPRVKSVHKIIEDYRERDYRILIVGRAAHPETIGHKGYAGKNGIIVSSVEEAMRIDPGWNCVIIAQTTISETLFNEVCRSVSSGNTSVERVNTICPFTMERQKWIETYSKIAGYSLIIGGKKSSNTGILYEIALANGDGAWIEEPGELSGLPLTVHPSIAVTGGTSTPKEVLEEAAAFFNEIGASLEYA
jgi:4-hydroxy-3-methylbut-2-enyl diphosphate reductase